MLVRRARRGHMSMAACYHAQLPVSAANRRGSAFHHACVASDMKTAEIRRQFLEFFRQREHVIVPSAPLVPAHDPTLMFTNAGMVPFKNVFLGSEKPVAQRVVDVQRCLRAGGKHNDLDQVGYTARHHTFFEMLGNWSFGDYFKRQAIAWSWELLTEVFGLPADKLWVTVYATDEEAFAIWHDEIGVPAERIRRIGDASDTPYDSDNFWQMADTGPCGPCSEIFYDHGPDVAGGPPGSDDAEGDRYIEVWNLVFMQYDRQTDGEMKPLPAPCVDTGMGLERIAAILQGVHSNYEIDLFQRLITAAAGVTGVADSTDNQSLRVIADHIRACSFLIVDAVTPSNEGRGYVLRRIIRRALRHGWMLGVRGEFFWKMVAPLVAELGTAYPELAENQQLVEQTLQQEEARFGRTLEHGMRVFDEVAAGADGMIAGDDAFRLYDTYGFPLDLTADIARERGLAVDMAGFDEAMQAQRDRARAASRFQSRDNMPADLASRIPGTEFLGYEALEAADCTVQGIIRDGVDVAELAPGEEGVVVLDRTPFYAESGGQVGDTGTLSTAGGAFTVTDTRIVGGVFFAHAGTWQGDQPVKPGASLTATVDAERRQAIVLNHSATHLLHAALRLVLGNQVTQKGSLVAPDRLRFDFAHENPVSREDLDRIEALVNNEIRRNTDTRTRVMSYDDAIADGAMALFGEKYGDNVRVMTMGDFSTELCGGTHVARTGDIGLFRIVSETGIAAGVRRIEAVTGEVARQHVNAKQAQLEQIGELLAASEDDVGGKLRQLLERQKKLESEVQRLQAKAATDATGDLVDSATEVDGMQVVAARVDGLDGKALRESVDRLKQKLGDCVVVLASGNDGKAAVVAGVGGAASGRIRAGDVVAHVAASIGGKGGGRPDMAQGGGKDSPALDTALNELPDWLAG